MIPILYKSTEKDFNHNGLGQMIEMIEATVTEQRNGEFEFYGEYPVSGRLYDSIDDFMFIKAKPNSVDDPHVFRIYEHELDINTQTVLLYATTKSNDLGSNMVINVNINDETPLEAMNKMKNNLIEPTEYMFYSDINTRSSTRWTRRNPLNCIAGEEGSLLQFWGGEIKRSNTVISLFSRRGKDNVTTIRHGKNLTGLTMNYSTKGMVTLIVPFFTHTPEGKDEEETIIGTNVKSQYINNYPLSYIKEVDYSQDDDVKDLATLNTKASKYFQENTGIDVPTLSATVNIDDLSDSSEYAKFKNLENIELTDTITVYAKKYKVNITAKVNSLTYDVLADKNRELEIGSIRNTFFDDTVKQVKDLVREAEVILVNTIQLAANGKNKIFRGVDEPLTGMTLNDLWYKPVGAGEIELYNFDGAYWQLEKVSAGLLGGTLDAENGDVNLINVNASSIVAESLSAITTNTGALNVSDWLTFSTENRGIRASYDFGDPYNNSYDPKWFSGESQFGYKHLRFISDVYKVNSNNTRGSFDYYSEAYYGPDYLKLRKYQSSTTPTLIGRVDITGGYITMSDSFDTSNIYLNTNGDAFFGGNVQVGGDLSVMNLKSLKAYTLQAPDNANNIYINGYRNDLGSMRFGVDGSTLNSGRLVSSDSVYNRTYSSAANMVVFDTGTIGRSVSARKYKLNIESETLLETALKTLTISPSSWFDKGEVESISKCLTDKNIDELDANFKATKHYGFIADEFNEIGAKEVVFYNSEGEVEGLAYDRISMYHHELIKDLYRKIDYLEKN